MSLTDRVPRSFGTHHGPFHADEVTACALLLITDLIDVDRIVRTRDPKLLASCEFVADVGGMLDPAQKRFDHHQVEYTGEQASAGLVLQYLEDQGFFSKDLAQHLRHSLIVGVDAIDTGKLHAPPGLCSFSQVISNFNPPIYDAPKEAQDRAFGQALAFVRGHLERLIARWQVSKEAQESVKQAMHPQQRVLLFDHPVAWQDAFFSLGGEHHPAQFVIMPMDEHWKLRAIPPNARDRMQVRCPMPKSWAGLLDEELERTSGVQGAVFCHKERFISVWKSREAALKALQCILESEHLSAS